MPISKNVLVLGNCQARPVATYLQEMTGEDFHYTPLIAHLSNVDYENDDLQLLDTADLILSQPIADSFKAPHLATSLLKSRYANKVITWPNLFFIGQTPDIVTLRDNSGKVVVGPLESYQSAGVVNCWKQGMTVDQTVQHLQNELPFSAEMLENAIKVSLSNLIARESDLDVHISDFIQSKAESERLFFTFNHPTSRLLIELCERLTRICDLHVIKRQIGEFGGEPLGRLTAPTTTALANLLGLKFPYTNACKGIEISIENDNLVKGKSVIYSFHDFVKTSYMALEHQLTNDQSLSSTPPFEGLQ